MTRTNPTLPADATRTETKQDRWAALALLVGPLVMLAGYLAHPFMPTLGPEAVNQHLRADENRWFISHLLIALGSGLLALSFLAMRRLLRAHGDRTSAWALPWTVLGSAAFVLPPGMELGLLAAARGGADVLRAQAELDAYFLPILMASNLLFLVGAVGFALGVRRTTLLGTAASWRVAIALVVMAAVRFIPSGIQFYVGGVAGLVAFWPLAYAQWQAATATRHHAGRAATA